MVSARGSIGKDKKKKESSFQSELKVALDKIDEITLGIEANVVSIMWKNPSLFYERDDIKIDDFNHNHWRVYFEIGQKTVAVEDKPILDDITVSFFLDKHDKLKEKYVEYGGYNKIVNATEYVNVENFDGYVNDLHKYNAIRKLGMLGFPINERMSAFADMRTEQVYAEYEVKLNAVFMKANNSNIKSYDISDGMYELIDELDKGLMIGLPFYHLPLLTEELGGLPKGDVTLIGGLSNVGKSTFVRLTVLPTIFNDSNARLAVFMNEEGKKKWQFEMIAYVANNIYTDEYNEIQKIKMREGHYTPEFKKFLQKCADWYIEKKEQQKITLIPLDSWSTDSTLTMLKKFAAQGRGYFIIDTFKADNDVNSKIDNNTRLQMVQNMTKIYNIAKTKDLCIICTIQLVKSLDKVRYYGLSSIGESKNIVDPCSTAIFIRNFFPDEMPDGNNQLRVFTKINKTDTTIPLERNKKYQIIFIPKSRTSMAGIGSHQIVIEVDYGRNIIKEIGYTNVPVDF